MGSPRRLPGRDGPPPALLALLGLLLLALVLPACRADPRPEPTPSVDDLVRRSQALLELQVRGADGPGCIGAVGERGVVRWESAHGLADLDARTPISDTTSFELASVSKPFTALAVLLLEQDGALSTTDPVARHVDGLPSWGRRVTLAHLVHHTSGIADYFEERVKGDPSGVVGRRAVLATIAGQRRLDFEPGTRWEYSNANYVLLAEVVEEVSGQTYPDFLRQRVFEPLGLMMLASAGPATPGLAPSYTPTAAGFEPGTWGFYAMGAIGVRSDLPDLVRWADLWRTGAVGGLPMLDAQWDDAPETGLESSRYGPGMFRLPDGSLYDDGFYGGYRSGLLVSPDREHEAVLLCNRTAGVEPDDFVRGLARVWGFR